MYELFFFFCLCACAGYIFSSTANLFPEFLTAPSSSPNKKVKKNRVKGLVCLLQWYGSKCQWQSHNGSRQNTGVYHLIVDVPFGMFHRGVQTQESAERTLLWPTGFIFLSLDSPGEAYKMSCEVVEITSPKKTIQYLYTFSYFITKYRNVPDNWTRHWISCSKFCMWVSPSRVFIRELFHWIS